MSTKLENLGEIIETDVLVVGGGIAGMMAAIKAGDLGAKVTVAEKANTKGSGDGGMGNDHFFNYIPEIHGPMEPYVKGGIAMSGIMDEDIAQQVVARSNEVAMLWEKFGIPMKYKGETVFAGHAFPGIPSTAMKYAGQDQKLILTKEAFKRGVKIINRVMVTELLVDDNRAVGAIGVSAREKNKKIIIFKTKSVFIATGNPINRLYPGVSGNGWLFNSPFSPHNTGDGHILVYKAGAELIDCEWIFRWAGIKYMARAGRGTWIGILKNAYGKTFAPPYLTEPNRDAGDIAAENIPALLRVYQEGKAPIYMDCSATSDDDLEFMKWGLMNEGNQAIFGNLKKRGIDDIRKIKLEFHAYQPILFPAARVTSKWETNVSGLYAMLYGLGISFAVVGGWIGGEEAAKYAKSASPFDLEKVKGKIEEKKRFCEEIQSREKGAKWQEANIALTQIMNDYAGWDRRSETQLLAGAKHIRRLREETLKVLRAENSHELVCCLETLNLMDIGEIACLAANERKETRWIGGLLNKGSFRIDYPFPNPLLNKLLVVKQVEGKPKFRWEELRRL